MTWLKAGGNDFDSRKALFLLPGKRDQYHDFLIRELVAYRDFRLGLEERPEDIPPEDYIQMTRIRNVQAMLINTTIPITEVCTPK